MRRDLWIFGYGSLIWRPAFPYLERHPGYIEGYQRRFWQASPDHRGTPEAPGRVVTLFVEPRATCWGTVYRVATEHREQILAELDHREKAGYQRVEVDVHLRGSRSPGAAAPPSPAPARVVEALVYVATADNPNYLGPASLADIARVVRRACGPSGSNREYVLRLAEALRAMGANDPHLFDLAGHLATDR